ncbi:MAG TPA: hypothetical protein VL354_09605 [Spirochaetia bacterium]|nr:hypothetical protein [Spirochaetia bacterium]
MTVSRCVVAIGSLGYIFWCVPAAKSFFGPWTAGFGIALSVMGLAGSVAPVVPSSFILGLCQFLCVRLLALWFIVVGIQLLRYVRRLTPGAEAIGDPASP